MAKRYPKKLRMKLEKIAEGRDQRQTADKKLLPWPQDTLWWTFYPKRSIALMSAKIDEQRMRLTTVNHMDAELAVDAVYVKPPWLGDESAASG